MNSEERLALWMNPERDWPEEGAPVICITVDGDVVWLKRIGEGWMESDCYGRSVGNLVREPASWTHPPRLYPEAAKGIQR